MTGKEIIANSFVYTYLLSRRRSGKIFIWNLKRQRQTLKEHDTFSHLLSFRLRMILNKSFAGNIKIQYSRFYWNKMLCREVVATIAAIIHISKGKLIAFASAAFSNFLPHKTRQDSNICSRRPRSSLHPNKSES